MENEIYLKNTTLKILKYLILIIYLFFLIKVIIFKYPLPVNYGLLKNSELSLALRIDRANFIPFKSISNYLGGNFSFSLSVANLLGNIIIFMPLGILVPTIFDELNKLRSIFIISFLLSLNFEIVQILSGLGSFDVDDIILNVFGAVVGYLIYKLSVWRSFP